MARGHQRPRPVVEERFEGAERVEIEIVGRLVEHQQVRLGRQHHHQLQPTTLAAREHLEPVRTGRSSRTRTVRAAHGPPSRVAAAVRPPTHARSRRGRATTSADRRIRRPPSCHASPDRSTARVRPATMSSRVDLPDPFGPTTPSRAPGSITRSTSRNTTWSSYALRDPDQLDHLVAEPGRAGVEQQLAAAHTEGLGSAGRRSRWPSASRPWAWSSGPAHRAAAIRARAGRGSCGWPPRWPPARVARRGPRGTPRTRSCRPRPGGRSPSRVRSRRCDPRRERSSVGPSGGDRG